MHGSGAAALLAAVLFAAAPLAAAAGTEPTREQWLATAQQRLATGDVAGAEQGFDAAASMAHAVDAEIGLVLTYLQAGDYRRAVSFAAHASGAHEDEPQARALYIWLLDRGGQQRAAAQLLADALRQTPDATPLVAVARRLGAPRAESARSSVVPPGAGVRFGPYPTPARPVAGGTSVTVDATAAATAPLGGALGSATLVAAGRRALVPAALLQGARSVWLRNGLGQTVRASRLPDGDAVGTGIALLQLDEPLRWPSGLRTVPREPFAGSPASAIGYDADPADSDAKPPRLSPRWPARATSPTQWPAQRLGFFGPASGNGGIRPLGIGLPGGAAGGPVFDAAGRLAGVLWNAQGGMAGCVPLSAISQQADVLPAAAPDAHAARQQGFDAVYEIGLLIALQVFAAD